MLSGCSIAVLYFHRNVPWIDAVGMLYPHLERVDVMVYQIPPDMEVLEYAGYLDLSVVVTHEMVGHSNGRQCFHCAFAHEEIVSS